LQKHDSSKNNNEERNINPMQMYCVQYCITQHQDYDLKPEDLSTFLSYYACNPHDASIGISWSFSFEDGTGKKHYRKK
jgi:hypothetical protein